MTTKRFYNSRTGTAIDLESVDRVLTTADSSVLAALDGPPSHPLDLWTDESGNAWVLTEIDTRRFPDRAAITFRQFHKAVVPLL